MHKEQKMDENDVRVLQEKHREIMMELATLSEMEERIKRIKSDLMIIVRAIKKKLE